MAETIVRIAARGEGVTDRGRHVPLTAPGDVILDDGAILAGSNRQVPPCRHFPECGGCQLQHLTDQAYRDYLVARVIGALAQHGLTADVREPHLSPPNSRRRASLRALRTGQGVIVGFNAAGTHRIVDVKENYILRAELLELLEPLRILLGGLLKPRGGAEIQMTLTDQGVDLLLRGAIADGLPAIERMTEFAIARGVARLTVDRGEGPETLFEPQPASVTLSGSAVRLPVGAFLQATTDGEAALVSAVIDATDGAASVADLFAGLGTFALALPARTYAAEAARDAVMALQAARPTIVAEHRDLYRRPLDSSELARFDAVVLDPPRAGAEHQVRQLALSSVAKLAYVSCNPATFARDAATLVGGGYELDWVRPIGQFRWSTHVELAACLTRR